MLLEIFSSIVHNLGMSALIEQYLSNWPKPYIRDQDLQSFFFNKDSRRYDAVKYAIKKEYLLVLKRGLYFINLPYKKQNYDPYEIAQAIYNPSYISLESALSFHGWIPEAVYTTTSATPRRSKEFDTPKGYFSFAHIPSRYFYDEVNRIESDTSIFLMAEPWKALADYIYVHKKQWSSIRDLYFDMRIEIDTLEESSILALEKLVKNYDSKRVRIILNNLLKDLKA